MTQKAFFYTPKYQGVFFPGKILHPTTPRFFSGCTVNLNFSFAFFEGGGSKKRNRKITFYTLKKSGCKFKNRGVENFYTLFFEFTPGLHPEIFLNSGCKFSPLFVLKFLFYTPIFILHPDFYINIFLKNNIRGGKGKIIYIKRRLISHTHTRAHV